MSGFTVSIQHTLNDLVRGVEHRQRDVQAWTRVALNETAKEVMSAEVASIAEVFDRPTRFTQNALFVRYAKGDDLVAEVRFKEGFGSIPAWRYLGPQVEGGLRVKKSHERALERAGILRPGEFVVPGEGVTLDQHGNMKGGQITRILSELGANPDPLSNSTARSRKRAKGRGRYFVLRPDAGDPRSRVMNRKAAPGIYWRKGSREIVPVMIFVRAPRYTKRFPFYETARQVVDRRFAANFRAAIARFPSRAR